MGICASCCEDSNGADRGSLGLSRGTLQKTQPDLEERRQLQAEAAEKRLKQSDARGVADVARVERQQKKRDDYERTMERSFPSERTGGLRWTAG